MIRQVLNRLLPAAHPVVCDDVARWAGEHHLPVRQIHEPVRAEVEPFIVQDKDGVTAFAVHRADFDRPQHLVCLENTRVRGINGLVILPDGSFCVQGNWHSSLLKQNPDYSRRISFPARPLPGDCYSLLSLWAPEYCHWFSDVLPRLHTALPFLPPGTRFLVNVKPHSYQLQSLACYGIGPDRLVAQPWGIDSRPERLWFATPLGHTSGTSGKVLKAMRHTLRSGLGLDPHPAPSSKRLWISRAKAPLRHVVNEADLLPILARHHVDICPMETLDWRDQIDLLGDAQWLIGPHGAGLTNLLFAPNCQLVGEVHVDGPLEYFCYMVKARQLGIHYADLVATPAPSVTDPQAMSIDVDRFSDWLSRLETIGSTT